MQIRRFADSDAFYAHIEAFLLANEPENNLLFGILNNVRSGEYAEAYMACVEHEGRIMLVALRTPPYSLLLSRSESPDAFAPLVADLQPDARFYFVHSYHIVCEDETDVVAYTDYGYPLAAIIGKDNVMGAQFHPEKSHRYGMQLLKNFAERVS